MQSLGAEVTLKELDRLLDSLEQLASCPQTSIKEFNEAVLRRLCSLLPGASIALVAPIPDSNWRIVCSVGNCNWHELLDQIPHAEAQFVDHLPTGLDSIVLPIRKRAGQAALLVKLGSKVDKLAYSELVQLCKAFAEVIAQRLQFEIESLRDAYLPAFIQLHKDIASAGSSIEAEIYLVNGLLPILMADRISVAKQSLLASPRISTISNTPGPITASVLVSQLEQIGKRVFSTGKPEYSQELTEHGQLDELSPTVSGTYYIAFPLSDPTATPRPHDTVLIVQWATYEAFSKGMVVLNQVGQMLAVAWSQHQRWLRIPGWIRTWNQFGTGAISSRPRQLIKWTTWTLVVAGILWALIMPANLRIEMDGTFEPVDQRTLFAPLDGTVDQVLVTNGQAVQKGQLLLAMKSTQLELDIRSVEGELSANAEKRKGLSLSQSQLSSDPAASPAIRNKLTAEIGQLDSWAEVLQQKLDALRLERQRLELRAPQDGVIVARDLDKLLEQRPVRRGDSLFRIADPSGDWCLKLEIADADIGYVKKQVFANSMGSRSIPVKSEAVLEFIFVAQPDVQFDAQISWISTLARNPRGDGVIIDAIAEPATASVAYGHIGATVKAYLSCGQRQTWFVLSRPLVEAIQRKLWF
ncbi:MAG: HlyD family efflux transporter periplasmic adaptor subunit [Pirellulaceae bacterium]|nr:HlyD family efflux transporter periplasmic adaptor subunit [Pirellulaceae bacterium]